MTLMMRLRALVPNGAYEKGNGTAQGGGGAGRQSTRREIGPSLSVARIAQLARSSGEVSILFCGRMRAPAARHIRLLLYISQMRRQVDHVPYFKYGAGLSS
jgi:hypothetical protein